MKTTDWHRLFGLTLTDFFHGTSYTVELEKDLSLKQQFLDIVIIEKKEGDPPDELPDGLEYPAPHNLISYKSHQESLEAWTLDELTGHYVNYRKQISPSLNELSPENDFRLYAVCTRYPKNLAEKVSFTSLKQGVYEVIWGIRQIRIIVLSRIPQSEKNAVWHLFSAVPEKVRYGASCYRWRQSDVSTVINQLFIKYNAEGVIMPYTVEDYVKEVRQDVLGSLSEEEVEKLLKKIPAKERLKGIPAKERLKGIPLEERLTGLTQEEIEAYLKKLKQEK